MAAIIDSKWSNSPHTTKNEDIYATSSLVFCGNYSVEELMSFKFKKEGILKEKTMSKTTVMHCGNKPLSGAGPARDRCFIIAKELRKHLPTLLHLTMKALDGQMTEDERQLYLHIHKDDRYILDLVEYRRWALAFKKAMQEAEVDVPDVLKPEEIDVSSLAYYFLKGRTSLKDVIKFCVLNDRTDVLVLTRRQTTGVLGFKVLEQDFLDAPDEIKKFVHSCESVPLTDKGKKKRMTFMPIQGLSKKDLELVLRNRMSVAAELCKALATNLEFSNQIQVSFVNSMMKHGLKRKRLVGKKVVLDERADGKRKKKPVTRGLERNEEEVDQGLVNENFAEAAEELVQNDVNDRVTEELDGEHIERGFAPDVPLTDEFLNNNTQGVNKADDEFLNNNKPGGSGGLRCSNPNCIDFTKTFKIAYHYKQHIGSKKHQVK